MRMPAIAAALLGATAMLAATQVAQAHNRAHRHTRHHHAVAPITIPTEKNAPWDASVPLTFLSDWPYSETLPPYKPADVVLDSLKDVPEGTPVEEIQRAADAFGLDFRFLRAVAHIESDFNPKDHTGSYIGLFQLSEQEFATYGSGVITDARDNAVAAAYKFVVEAALFEQREHKKPTYADLYLIHQQGEQGAEQHIDHPDRIAWESMCATDEGKIKGEAWCKRAIWQNTLPAIKQLWGSVDRLTSGDFVKMWADRIAQFYAFIFYQKKADAE